MITVATDEQLRKWIAANVRERLDILGWSQVDLAQKSGENQPTINRVCRGENLAGAGVLSRIAKALGSSADVLMSEPEKKSPVTS